MIIKVSHLRLNDARMTEIGGFFSNLSPLLSAETLPAPHNNVPPLEVHLFLKNNQLQIWI